MTLARTAERLAILGVSLALSVALILLLSGYFDGRDQAGVTGTSAGVGEVFPNLGNAVLKPGQPRPHYSSDPPTSGAHLAQPVTSDGARLNNDQLLEALAAGDVVVMYGTRRPPPGLLALATRIAGPFTPLLAAAGQAVVLAQRPGTRGLIALAWTHLVRVSSPSDSLLSQFANYWLGRGASGR